MVKIIRLTTQNTDGSFETRFNAPLNIEAKSKIALQNLIMAVPKKTITVNSTNDGMTFQITTGNIRTAKIQRATYDNTNAGEKGLLLNIQEALNAALQYITGKELGSQFRVSLGTRITIETEFSVGSNFKTEMIANIPSLSGNPVIVSTNLPNNDFTLAGVSNTPVTDNTQFTFLDRPICKGVGSFRTKIHTLIDETTDAESGFIVALVKKEPSLFAPNGIVTAASAIKLSDIYWGIKVNKVGSGYSIIDEGVESATGTSPNYIAPGSADNDILDIHVSGGSLNATIWYNGGSELLSSKTSNNDASPFNLTDIDLYPVIIMRGSDVNAIARGIQFYQDPFFTPPTEDIIDHNIYLGVPSPPTQRGAKRLTQQFIQFDSESLALQLGYSPNRFPAVGTRLLYNIVWTSENDYDILSINDNYQVVLDNVFLDSYDSLDKGQKNLLAVLPVKDDIGAIRYDSNSPIFVDANNRVAISLKNIRLRVLRADGTQVDSTGLSTATILVES